MIPGKVDMGDVENVKRSTRRRGGSSRFDPVMDEAMIFTPLITFRVSFLPFQTRLAVI